MILVVVALDVSLLSIHNGIFSVLASTGNMRLGGSDFDNRLIQYSIHQFIKKHPTFNFNNLNPISLQKLRNSCENAKQLLSSVLETHIIVKDFYENIDLCYIITRKEFEFVCRDLFMICINPIENILKNYKNQNQIDEVILVGGMTRIPIIRDLIKIKTNIEPNCTINPDEAVAVGAAIQGYILSHVDSPFSETVTLLDATALSLGVEVIGGLMNNHY